MTQYAFFIWDGKPNNMVKVCLESLRHYNSKCVILFYYLRDEVVLEYSKLNIRFRKIDKLRWDNRRMFHKIELIKKILDGFYRGDQVLVLDCDLLFQEDPFSMFNKFPNNDFYYTTTFYSYIIPEKYNRLVDPVNGGVWGIEVNQRTIKLLEFWINNMIYPSWDNWVEHLESKNYAINTKKKLERTLDWWMDQLFITCLHFADVEEIPIRGFRKVNLGFQYNFFFNLPIFDVEYKHRREKIQSITSMNIGNRDVYIIHFKGELKNMYDIMNSDKYNLEFLLDKKKTEKYYTSEEFIKKIELFLECR